MWRSVGPVQQSDPAGQILWLSRFSFSIPVSHGDKVQKVSPKFEMSLATNWNFQTAEHLSSVKQSDPFLGEFRCVLDFRASVVSILSETTEISESGTKVSPKFEMGLATKWNCQMRCCCCCPKSFGMTTWPFAWRILWFSRFIFPLNTHPSMMKRQKRESGSEIWNRLTTTSKLAVQGRMGSG